jgi:hypothetical protein
MSATPSTMARFRPLSAPRGVESGKPVGSVPSLRIVPNHWPGPRSATPLMLPNEPEDARLTGGTRSLDRRLLALNLYGVRSGNHAA